MSTLPLVHVEREAAGEPEGALILLHGRGADEHDLQPVVDVLDPERRLVAITPGAPLPGPPGAGGRWWYMVPRVGFPDPATFHATYAQLTAFLDGWLEQRSIPWERTIIGGFSMGCVMSYATALGPGRPSPAGILAMSGFIPTVEGWEPDLEGRAGLPVFITHGSRDPVISVDFARDARARLETAGLAVEYHEHPGGHHLDPRTLPLVTEWVGRRRAAFGESTRRLASDDRRT
jgi:phospholipase/carboxylesterase